MSDWQLLRAYADARSEAAFGKLVNKHLKFVYWTCRRDTRDDHLAEDATQAVFLLLARKAGSIGRDVSIPGWLFNAARLVSRNAVRQQARRVKAEQEAAQLMPHMESLSEEWMGIEPWLNDALGSLNSDERAAVLLRYFAEMSLEEAGLELGISDKTASKRVVSAIEKMRRYLRKNGVTINKGVLAAVLAKQSAQAMPAHLDATMLHALSNPASASAISSPIDTPITALHQGVHFTMQAAKYKAAATAIAALALVAAGITIPILHARSGNRATVRQPGNPNFALIPAPKPIVINAGGNDASDLPFAKSLQQHEEATAHLTFTWEVAQSGSVGARPRAEVDREVENSRKDAIEQAKIKGITNPAAVQQMVESAIIGARDDGNSHKSSDSGTCAIIRDGAKTVLRTNLHTIQSIPAAFGDSTGYTFCEGNLIVTATTASRFRFATAPTVPAQGNPNGGVWYSVGDSVRYDLDGPGTRLNLFPEELSLISGLNPLCAHESAWRIVSATPSAFVLEAMFKNGRHARIILDRSHDNLPSELVLYLGSSDRYPCSYRVLGYTKHGGMWVCSKITCTRPFPFTPQKREWVLTSVTDTQTPETLTLPEFTTIEDYRLLGPIIDYSATYNASRANDSRICTYLWRSKLPTEAKLPTLLRGPGLSAAALPPIRNRVVAQNRYCSVGV